MRLFHSYLKSRSRAVAACLSVICIFSASYLLFDMPVIVTAYPLSISLLICTAAAALDYMSYCLRHSRLTRNEMPSPADQIESDYQKIIADLEDEAEKAALRASENFRDMTEYYTVWAHQIKTPIAAMRLTLQSEDSETARRLSGDLNRIEEYVEMVLTYIRLDSDDTDYLIREYDLDEIIKPAVRRFSREFILKKLTLDYRPAGYTVLTDAKWLSFVIEQIISNAVKYTWKGGVKIFMEEPGILCIEDTGIGISAEDLPRIFENGYTGFNGREDKKASGIGLYLCRRITGHLGHRISAESAPGAGTRVRLDLRKHDLGVE